MAVIESKPIYAVGGASNTLTVFQEEESALHLKKWSLGMKNLIVKLQFWR